MSVIKKIGEFIVENSQPIEVAAVLIAVVLAVIFIVKSIANSNKKQQLLNQINETVTEINSNVSNLGKSKSDVIYIDNRSERQTSSAEETVESNIETAVEMGEAIDAEKSSSTVENNIPKKFFERDCGTDKKGRQYSEEKLINQIRE